MKKIFLKLLPAILAITLIPVGVFATERAPGEPIPLEETKFTPEEIEAISLPPGAPAWEDINRIMDEQYAKEIKEAVALTKINSVEVSTFIKKNGDMDITEVWKTENPEGSISEFRIDFREGDIVENIKITCNGKPYTDLGYWGNALNIEQSAYKYNIPKELNGDTVLYWGVSEYGNNEYKVSYTIKNKINAVNTGNGDPACDAVDMTFTHPYNNDDETDFKQTIQIEGQDELNEDIIIPFFDYFEYEWDYYGDKIEVTSIEPLGKENFVLMALWITKGILNDDLDLDPRTDFDIFSEFMSEEDLEAFYGESGSEEEIADSGSMNPMYIVLAVVVGAIIGVLVYYGKKKAKNVVSEVTEIKSEEQHLEEGNTDKANNTDNTENTDNTNE